MEKKTYQIYKVYKHKILSFQIATLARSSLQRKQSSPNIDRIVGGNSSLHNYSRCQQVKEQLIKISLCLTRTTSLNLLTNVRIDDFIISGICSSFYKSLRFGDFHLNFCLVLKNQNKKYKKISHCS
ncbi:hypothetical protein AAHE18_16G067100 [Arachis hypogaea]